VRHQHRIARIGQHLRCGLEQSQLALDLAQQQQSSVRTDFPAVESHLDPASPYRSKNLFVLGTLWHRRNPQIEWTSDTHSTRETMVAPTSSLKILVKYPG